MGEKDSKISTIVLKVDLECQRCYKKIRKVLCKIQDQMNIKTISYDEKSNSVTISGPFDAEMVCKKLCCKAGRAIKEMNIKGKESKGGGDKTDAKPKGTNDAKPKGTNDAKPKEEDAKQKKDDAKPKKEDDAKPKKEDDAKPNKEDNAKTNKEDNAKPKADIGPLLEKMMATMGKQPSQQPCREQVSKPAPAVPVAQGVAAHSIWPAPASSLAVASYNPSSYDSSYYGGGGGYSYGCGCGYGGGDCRCGKLATPAGGAYYGVPVYDNQGWYYGGRQPYYPQHQSCYEDPNAGCSTM